MKYHNITKCDMLNGDGLRVCLWVSGCSHHCPGCQNPITWDPDDGLLFDQSAKRELYQELDQDYISGITLTGGDPLYPANRSQITELCKEIKILYPGKTIWLYTGYCFEEIRDLDVLNYIDVLVDGPFLEDQKELSLMWKGSLNQRIIAVPETLASGTIKNHCVSFKKDFMEGSFSNDFTGRKC